MPAAPLPSLIRYLRRAAAPDAAPGASDACLLERYAESGDDSAFELLVWRQAQAVLGVCRRVVRDEHAAHDCFQAAFLALARSAKSIASGQSVGGWLYQVAYRTALKARRRLVKRAAREQPIADREPPSREAAPAEVAAWQELGDALDEEINLLPGPYREVLVLRCLAGKSIAEASGELGCPPGTVESRLARARERLRAALTRRGFLVPAGLLVGGWPGLAVEASVPMPLMASVVKAANLVAAGKVVLAGAISLEALALSEGALQTMTMTKATIALAVVLALGVGTGAVGLSDSPSPPPQPAGVRAEHQKAEQPKKDKDNERLVKELQDLREQLVKEREKMRERLVAAELQLRDIQKRAEQQERALQRRLEVETRRLVGLQREIKELQAKLTQEKEEVACLLQTVDVKKRTVRTTLRTSKLPLEALKLSQEVKVFIGPQEVTLVDLKEGMAVALRVKEEGGKPVVVEIRAAPAKK
jgi:RNA polymerase sigma factor (sigma-70 family)